MTTMAARATTSMVALCFLLTCVFSSTLTVHPPPTTLAAPAPPPTASPSTTTATTTIDDIIRGLADTTAARVRTDAEATSRASTDFGTNLTVDPARVPAAVFYPSCAADIAALLRASSASASPFAVTARGRGHSTRGQATAAGGVVIDMSSLAAAADGSGSRLAVSVDGGYIDAGGEQLWADVLHASLAHGLTPRSWTDYLRLTVGGTLSNAGISGQAFRHGPQISNVLELDVVTGTGEMVTCSKRNRGDLFDAVLGGLGQFGVITRARIPLAPAPARARWVRLLYAAAADLTADQERLIGVDNGGGAVVAGVMDYVEGSVLTDFQGLIGSWRSQPPSSFYSAADAARIAALAEEAGGVLYCLEGAVYYGGATDTTAADVDKVVEVLLRELRYARGFAFVQDVSYVQFLDRVSAGERKLRAEGLWHVPHPWLNLFLPRSRILDFAAGVFHGVLLNDTGGGGGPVLVYPMNRRRWDGATSAVLPPSSDGENVDEEVFYTVGILRSAVGGGDQLRRMEEQNAAVARFCEHAGIPCVQYLPSYATQAEWAARHFGGGGRWDTFLRRKRKYDPMAILSRGQGIFSSPLLAA